MKSKASHPFTLLLVVLFLIPGCSTSDANKEAVVVDELVVTFKPENCIYDGPTVIQHGEFTVFFDNQTDEVVLYDIFLLTEGKSWQDVVDNFAGGGRNVEMPDWAILQSGSINIKDTREKAYNLEPGSYALACSEILQTGGWIDYLGSPLEVK